MMGSLPPPDIRKRLIPSRPSASIHKFIKEFRHFATQYEPLETQATQNIIAIEVLSAVSKKDFH
jgi:hypothetical protein